MKELLSKKLVTPMAKRKAVGFLTGEMALSERRTCCLAGLSRSVQQCRPIDRDYEGVIARPHVLLRRERLALNRKRTYRLYRAEGPQM